MAFEAPTDEFNESNFDSPAAGNYHLQLVACEEDGGNKGEMICDFEVLAGTTPNQEGKTHREYFQKTIKALNRVHTLAVALGMISVDELKKLKAEGKSAVYDFVAAVGRQLCMGLVNEEYPKGSGKTKIRANFALYHVADEKVASWPKNKAMLDRAGIKLPDRPATPGVGEALSGL